jgi:pimeloyl-ACP methyl ester carboxylesterase
MQKPVTFKNCGQDIFGTLHLPDKKFKRPCAGMVLLHGFAGNRFEPHQLFVKMSRRLEAEGIASFRFDFRGCGESEGAFENLTLDGLFSDARAAIAFMRSLKEIDTGRIGLLGLSLGGAVAAAIAGEGHDRIECLALWAAVAVIREAYHLMAPEELLGNYGKQVIHDYYGNPLSQNFLGELMAFRPVERARGYRRPTLIIHGSNDEKVPSEQAGAYKEAFAGNGLMRFHLIEGANHAFSGLGWESELLTLTTQFLKSCFLRGDDEKAR